MINLFNGGRGNAGGRTRPIGKFPLTEQILSAYPWPTDDVSRIIKSMWAPWPGYAVDPNTLNTKPLALNPKAQTLTP